MNHILKGFSMNGRRSFSETSWSIGIIIMTCTSTSGVVHIHQFTDLRVSLDIIHIFSFIRYNHMVFQSTILEFNELPFVYGEVLLIKTLKITLSFIKYTSPSLEIQVHGILYGHLCNT